MLPDRCEKDPNFSSYQLERSESFTSVYTTNADLVLSNCNERAQSVAARAPNIDLYGTNAIFGHFDVCLEVPIPI